MKAIIIYCDEKETQELESLLSEVCDKSMTSIDLGTVAHRLPERVQEPTVIAPKCKNKFLFYTNTLDFRLIDKQEIGLFQYNHEMRCWEVVVAGGKAPIKLKRNVKSDRLVNLDGQFVQVNQKYIINVNYLIEVIDNRCHFYAPFEHIDYVKVGRFFRRKLIDKFFCL